MVTQINTTLLIVDAQGYALPEPEILAKDPDFWAEFHVLPSGCMVTDYTPLQCGHVLFTRGEFTNKYIHRIAREKYDGKPIPTGWEVHHWCPNKACGNPMHTEAMTRQQHRLIESGITEQQIIQLRELAATRAFKMYQLAALFNYSTKAVHNIITGASFANIGGPLTLLPSGKQLYDAKKAAQVDVEALIATTTPRQYQV